MPIKKILFWREYNHNIIIKAFLKEINGQELPKVKNEEAIIKEEEKTEGVECPECHQKTLTMTGGCSVCNNCGYSKCN